MRGRFAFVAIAILMACGGSAADRHADPPSKPPQTLYEPPPGPTVQCRITFRDTTSSAFLFRRIVLYIDGAPLLNEDIIATVVEHVQDGQPAHFDLDLSPGEHTVGVFLGLQGNGSGAYSYLKGYRFEIRSTRKLKGVDGYELVIIAYEQNPNGPIEERPAVRYEERQLPIKK
jgi:hypothetical protein